jgi:hypothetical protein
METTLKKCIAFAVDTFVYCLMLAIIFIKIENIFLLIVSCLIATYLYIIHIINKYPD